MDLTKQELARQVREYYQHLSYLERKAALFTQLDSIYSKISDVATNRYTLGEVSRAEQMQAADRASKVRLELKTVGHEIDFDQQALGQLLGLDGPVKAVVQPFSRASFSISDTSLIVNSAGSRYIETSLNVAAAQQEIERSKLRPQVSAGGYAQLLGNGTWYPGWQFGLNVPLINKGRQKSIQAAAVNTQTAQQKYQAVMLAQRAALAHLLHEQEKYEILIAYYEEQGGKLAAELLRNAGVNYQLGEADYTTTALQLEQAIQIELDQLENLYGLNLTIIELRTLVE